MSLPQRKKLRELMAADGMIVAPGAGTPLDLRLIEQGGLEDLQRSCVMYRAGQKKIARAYLKLAQGELSKRMKGPG